MDDDIVNVTDEPMPEPTPEQIAEWERQRREAWEAKIAPFSAAKQRIDMAEEYIIDNDFRISVLEIMGGESE